MTVGTKNMAGWGLEASFGSSPAAPTVAWPFRGERPNIRVEVANDEDTLTGVQETGSESVPVRRWIEASREMDARLDNIAYWWHKALGSINTTGSNSPYTHTITNNGTEKPSVTEFWLDELVSSTKLEAYPGLKVQRLSLRSQAGGKIIQTVDLIGKGAESSTGTTEVTAILPALNRDNPLTHAMISAFTLGGVDLKTLLREIEITIEPQYSINDEYGAGSLYIPKLECSGLLISVNIGLNYGAAPKALIDKILAQTTTPLAMTITDGTFSAAFNLYNVRLNDGGNPTGQRAKMAQNLSGRGYYSVSDSKAIQLVVVNSSAGTRYAA